MSHFCLQLSNIHFQDCNRVVIKGHHLSRLSSVDVMGVASHSSTLFSLTLEQFLEQSAAAPLFPTTAPQNIQHQCKHKLSYERGHSCRRWENCQNRYGNKVVGKLQTPGNPVFLIFAVKSIPRNETLVDCISETAQSINIKFSTQAPFYKNFRNY